jgi:hypothetical protein
VICLPYTHFARAHLIQFHRRAALYHAMIDLTRGIRRRLRKKRRQLCKYTTASARVVCEAERAAHGKTPSVSATKCARFFSICLSLCADAERRSTLGGALRVR